MPGRQLTIVAVGLTDAGAPHVQYRFGATPVTGSEAVEGLVFPDRPTAQAQIDAWLRDFEEMAETLLLRLILIRFRLLNPALTNAGQIVGKTATFDVTGSALTITVT